MTPIFSIKKGGAELFGGNLDDRLLRLEVTDADGVSSDSCEIELDDRDFALAIPPKGEILSVSMGYAGEGLTLMGLFTVENVRRNFAPRTMTITCKSADLRDGLKEQKTEGHKGVDVGGLVEKIAGRNGLGAKVSDSLKSLKFTQDYMPQTEQSDMDLLTGLSRQYDATFKVAGGKILFIDKSDKIAGPFTLTLTDFIECEVEIEDRPRHGKTTAHWHDQKKVKRVPESAQGGKGPEYTLRHTFAGKPEAKKAAEAKKKQLDREKKKINGKITGNTAVMAAMPLRIVGIADGYDGLYRITEARHIIEDGGVYTTEFDAETLDQQPD